MLTKFFSELLFFNFEYKYTIKLVLAIKIHLMKTSFEGAFRKQRYTKVCAENSSSKKKAFSDLHKNKNLKVLQTSF